MAMVTQYYMFKTFADKTSAVGNFTYCLHFTPGLRSGLQSGLVWSGEGYSGIYCKLHGYVPGNVV